MHERAAPPPNPGSGAAKLLHRARKWYVILSFCRLLTLGLTLTRFLGSVGVSLSVRALPAPGYCAGKISVLQPGTRTFGSRWLSSKVSACFEMCFCRLYYSFSLYSQNCRRQHSVRPKIPSQTAALHPRLPASPYPCLFRTFHSLQQPNLQAFSLARFIPPRCQQQKRPRR